MRFIFKNFIEIKKIVILILMFIILCFIFELLTYYHSSNALYDSICQSFQDRAVDNSRLLSEVFEQKLKELEMIACDYEMQSMKWEIQKLHLLKYMKILEVKRLQVIDKNGRLLSTDELTADVSDRKYFKAAMAGITNISDMIQSRIDGSTVIICATPIQNEDGSIVGALSETIDYPALSKIVEDIQIGEGGYAFLINNEGIMIAHPDKRKVLSQDMDLMGMKHDKRLKDLGELERKMIKGETGFGFYEEDGIEKFMSFTPVANTPWVLGLTIPKSEIFSKLESLRNRYIAGTVIFILSVLIMGYLIAIYLVQRKKVVDLKKEADENYQNLMQVTESDKLKTEFFVNISHEFRTPINVILGSLQLFEFYTDNKTAQGIKDTSRRIKIMKQNCLRLLRLVNNLIDATKIDSGFLEINLKNDDIVQVIEKITLSVSDYVKQKGIELTFDTDIEEKIMAFDHDMLEKIVLNLLANATKFTGEHGSITVNVFDKGDSIVLAVKDTGIGIPEDKQKFIFERFRQVDKSLTRSHEGSGIGLSLVKSLVEMHKGRIYVQSELGKGSEFIVELPVQVLQKQEPHYINNYNGSGQNYVEKVSVEFSDIYL